MTPAKKRPRKSRRLMLRIDDDLGEAIQLRAERERRPIPNLIRNALRDVFLPRHAASRPAA